jgi:hypothetical protein
MAQNVSPPDSTSYPDPDAAANTPDPNAAGDGAAPPQPENPAPDTYTKWEDMPPKAQEAAKRALQHFDPTS